MNALAGNQTTSVNTAAGSGALHNNNGDNNTATGFDALYNNFFGTQNTATGVGALFSNINGSYNRPASPAPRRLSGSPRTAGR